MIVKTNLGGQLRKWREAQDLSQVDVAKKLKCRSQFISNWERGDSSPPWRLLKILVRLYKVKEQDIMGLLVEEHARFIKKQLGFK